MKVNFSDISNSIRYSFKLEMALKIRLARGGAKKNPFYRIVIAENTSPRDGKFVERIGHYDPMLPKGHENRFVLDTKRANYWISVGAKPTDTVSKILKSFSVVS